MKIVIKAILPGGTSHSEFEDVPRNKILSVTGLRSNETGEFLNSWSEILIENSPEQK